MDRITDRQSPVLRQVRPVAPLRAAQPLRPDGGEKPFWAPYGVVDRVTLSPEGRAMAMQQRVALSVKSTPQMLTYGPGLPPAAPVMRLPYTPDI